MNRNTLIQQVKDEYARLADLESRGHVIHQTYGNISPEAYYENRLAMVIKDIENGRYDHFSSGMEIVEQVANHKTKSERIRDNIESTLHNMELTEQQIHETQSNRTATQLQDDNERRAEAVTSMIRQMKEVEAMEAMESGRADIVGGGGAL